jgi:hypothetical protein
LALAVLIAAGVSADGLKSGLQVGSSPTPFHPLHVTGESAGEKACLI